MCTCSDYPAVSTCVWVRFCRMQTTVLVVAAIVLCVLSAVGWNSANGAWTSQPVYTSCAHVLQTFRSRGQNVTDGSFLIKVPNVAIIEIYCAGNIACYVIRITYCTTHLLIFDSGPFCPSPLFLSLPSPLCVCVVFFFRPRGRQPFQSPE